MADLPATLKEWLACPHEERNKYWDYLKESFSQSGYTLYIISPHPGEYSLCLPDDHSFTKTVYQSNVWVARKDGKDYWIKVIHKGANLNDCVDAQIFQKFESLPIVPLHEMLCFQEWWFSVTEEHGNVWRVFFPPRPIRKGIDFGRQLLQALVSFHHHNIAHLDIDLCNILATPDHTFLLIDFGRSCITDGVTPTTSVYGGHDNIAPEMEKTRRGEPYDPFAADIFASGLLLISFLHAYKPLYEFTDQLFPLFGKMVEKVPKSRILACDALDEYNRIVSQIPEDRLGELRRFRIRHYVTPPRFDHDVAISLMKWCQEEN